MNKFIKFLLLGVIVCIAICLGFSVKKSNSIPKSEAAWEEKYPAVFKTAGNMSIKLSTSNIVPNQNMAIPESMAKLEGTITNKFGIRDDILEYIINTVPKDNRLVIKAALKMAKIRQTIYYENISTDDAVKLADNDSLLTACLRIYTGNYGIDDGIDKRMRDNKDRDSHMWIIDRKFFSWKIIGSSLSVADEKIACEKGDF